MSGEDFKKNNPDLEPVGEDKAKKFMEELVDDIVKQKEHHEAKQKTTNKLKILDDDGNVLYEVEEK